MDYKTVEAKIKKAEPQYIVKACHDIAAALNETGYFSEGGIEIDIDDIMASIYDIPAKEESFNKALTAALVEKDSDARAKHLNTALAILDSATTDTAKVHAGAVAEVRMSNDIDTAVQQFAA